MDAVDLANYLTPVGQRLVNLRLNRLVRLGRIGLDRCIGRRLYVDVDGMRIYGTFKERQFLAQFKRGIYERYTVELFKKLVRPGMVVLDVGANVGYYSVMAGKLLRGRGECFSFEVWPATFEILKHNIRANGLEDVVRTVPKAAGPSAGSATMYAADNASVFNSVNPVKGLLRRKTAVEVVAIDDVVPHGVVNVAKIDVEGAEIGVLKGMEKIMQRSSEIVLFVECWEPVLKAAGVTTKDLVDCIRSYGFTVRRIDDVQCRIVPVEDGIYPNLLCTKGIQVEEAIAAGQ